MGSPESREPELGLLPKLKPADDPTGATVRG
jgi:hypothetical protein